MMKSMMTSVLAAGFFFVSVAAAIAAAPIYQEGQWEITTITDIPGMPKEMAKPHTYKTCLTAKEAVPRPEDRTDRQCKITDQSVSGNTATWKMVCTDGTTGEGKITYAKTSYEGVFTMTTTAEGRKMVIKNKMTGRYLGPCPTKK